MFLSHLTAQKLFNVVHSGLLICTLCSYCKLFACAKSQAHHAHNALGIDPLIIYFNVNVAIVLAGFLY